MLAMLHLKAIFNVNLLYIYTVKFDEYCSVHPQKLRRNTDRVFFDRNSCLLIRQRINIEKNVIFPSRNILFVYISI